MKPAMPVIEGILRSHMVKVPTVIRDCTGIQIFGKRIKSLAFTTDVAIIRNINADAIIAVYPFTPQPIITHSIKMAADIPLFVGVGGGLTTGKRVIKLAQDAEFNGALGVVVNAPTSNEIIKQLNAAVDIPIIITMVSDSPDMNDVEGRLEAGAKILNVSGASNTPSIVRDIRSKFPDVPIIATGGPTDESILETIGAGANAITYTPPTNAELFKISMEKYRDQLS